MCGRVVAMGRRLKKIMMGEAFPTIGSRDLIAFTALELSEPFRRADGRTTEFVFFLSCRCGREQHVWEATDESESER